MHCQHMTNATNKVKALLKIKADNYKRMGNPHPEVAAQYAVEGILHLYKGQPQFLPQLLDEEIEDALKAGRAL